MLISVYSIERLKSMQNARILAAYIVPDRDIDLMEFGANVFGAALSVTSRQTITLTEKLTLVFADNIFSLNSRYICEDGLDAGVVLVLLVPADHSQFITESYFDVHVGTVPMGEELAWFKAVKKAAISTSRRRWNSQVESAKLKVASKTSRIFAHVESLKKKEIIHRFNSLIYAVPPSRRNKIKINFASYVAGIISENDFKEIAGANSMALGHLNDINQFIKNNPNYVKCFKALVGLGKDEPTTREIQLLSTEYNIPTFELNYFAIKAK